MAEILKEVMDFIDKSPCSYYAVSNMKTKLLKNGFTELSEGRKWELASGGKYFVIRNDSALISFKIPGSKNLGFMITSCHSDSPCFKIKENPEIDVQGHYTKLSVEGYGGMIMPAWFDRPLSLAGRVIRKTAQGLEARLINLDRDLLMFVNQAVHMNRDINLGYQYKKNIDMIPLWGDGTVKGSFSKMIADAAESEPKDVVGSELFVYNRMKSTKWGADDCYFSAPRLDDLECAYIVLDAFMAAENDNGVTVFCLYDNEEVGSLTRQGAASTFLKDILNRIVLCQGGGYEEYLSLLDTSFMVSADNAHAVHPNFPEMSDAGNRCYMNEGIVIKYQAAQKYATDAVSRAVFQQICEKSGAKFQTYANRSDIAGGSTLGNLSSAQVPVSTVDIGFAQLAMHSPYETAGTQDVEELRKALLQFYKTVLIRREHGRIDLNMD